MNVLGKLHVSSKLKTLRHGVVGVAGEVKVGKGTSWEKVTAKHLANGLDVETETSDTALGSEEEEEDHGEKTGKDETPPRQRRLHHVETNKSDDPRHDKQNTPPPQRSVSVAVGLHELVVRVDALIGLGLLDVGSLLFSGPLDPEPVSVRARECLLDVAWVSPLPAGLDVFEVPEQHVSEASSETEVRGDEVADVGSGEPGDTLGMEGLLVDDELRSHDGGLVVDEGVGTVGSTGEQFLRQKGEVLSTVNVAVVHADEKANATDPADKVVDHGLKRDPERRAETSDVVPIEADSKETHTLVTGSTTEKVGENKALLVGETEDRDTLENGENVLGEELPDEHTTSNDPEEVHLLLDGSLGVVSLGVVQGLEQRSEGQVRGPKHLDGVNEDGAKQTGHGEADDLRRESQEDTGALGRVTTIEELLSGKSFSRQGRRGTGRGHKGDGGVFLEVERERVQPATNQALPGDEGGHGLAQGIGNDGQENDGYENGLGLEVENLLKNRTENSQTETKEPHTEGPRAESRVIFERNNGGDDIGGSVNDVAFI